MKHLTSHKLQTTIIKNKHNKQLKAYQQPITTLAKTFQKPIDNLQQILKTYQKPIQHLQTLTKHLLEIY